MINDISPKKLFQIHTEYPKEFTGLGGAVERVRFGKKYEI